LARRAAGVHERLPVLPGQRTPAPDELHEILVDAGVREVVAEESAGERLDVADPHGIEALRLEPGSHAAGTGARLGAAEREEILGRDGHDRLDPWWEHATHRG
jgi:hypothetical protein